MNLSGKSFTKAQFKLLGYNLNFIPTPNNINKKTISADIKKFGRRVKLRDHFGISHTDTPAFRSESSWEPAKNHHTVETLQGQLMALIGELKRGISTNPSWRRWKKSKI